MEPQLPLTFLVGYGRASRALSAGLERTGLIVRPFDRYAVALSEVARVRPDLILLGDAQAEGSPLQFLIDLKAEGYEGLVLFLSHSTDPTRASQALEAGAHDVVGPPHSVKAILLRRHVELRRRKQLSAEADRAAEPQQLSMDGVTVNPITREVSDGAAPFTLSGRELDVLVRLMEARGAVVPRESLLADIWGEEQSSEAVLDATVHRLRRRLDEGISRPEFVATVRGVGYRLRRS